MMKEWWQGLSMRERIILLIGGSLGSIIAIYFLFWLPLNARIDALHNEIQNQQSLLTWMQKATTELKQLRGKTHQGEKITAERLLTVTEQSLRTSDLEQYNPQITQGDQGKVTVKFKSIPFDNLISWLTGVWQQHQIQTEQLRIVPLKMSGLVEVDVILSV